MAELQFFTGTMDSGKSTLALQTNHNRAARGLVGRMFTTLDRAGTLDAVQPARAAARRDRGRPRTSTSGTTSSTSSPAAAGSTTSICDEAQFYTRDQIDQLAKVVDELQIDVFTFGILTDFRSELFPGSARLVELADRMHVLQVEALCWCGKRATHNARTENGEMVVEGEVDRRRRRRPAPGRRRRGQPDVAYEVLCRQHHRRRMTAARAKAVSLAAEPLPFG